MSLSDGRIAAWLRAKDCLEAARKPLMQRNRVTDDELTWQWHWSLLAEANVWALLAQSPMDVGLAAGTHMVEQETSRRQRDAALEDMFTDIRGKKE